jgi:hypothetical protein
MKLINNKHYQECDVKLLPTDKAEDSLVKSIGKLHYFKGMLKITFN